MSDKPCHCGNVKSFSNCCQPYIKGVEKVPTAEALMRSRYSAYCVTDADYLVATTHSSTRRYHQKEDIIQWSKSNQWLKLEVLKSSETVVEFKAYFLDEKLKATVHHEISTFKKEEETWFYVEGY